VSKIGAVMQAILEDDFELVEADGVDEANPWHDEEGRFSTEQDHLTYSLGKQSGKHKPGKGWKDQKGRRRPIKSIFGRQVAAAGHRGKAYDKYTKGALDGYHRERQSRRGGKRKKNLVAKVRAKLMARHLAG